MRLLLEGGNVFPDVTPFDHKEVPALLKTINDALKETGIKVIPIGSTATPKPGKTSGDMDVMADETAVAEYFKVKDAKSARKALAEFLRNKGYDVAQTGVNVHVKTPVSNQFVQVDIMVVAHAETISKIHVHDFPENSPYKGKNKALILNILSKMKGLFWSDYQGLFSRTPEGKKGELISNDIDTIAKTLLGQQAKASDLGSVESILNALPKDQSTTLLARAKEDPNWKEVAVKENFRLGTNQWFRFMIDRLG